MAGETRVALVVGNRAYKKTDWLDNPVNDAEAISSALQRLDFKVLDGRDLTHGDFFGIIRDFGRALKKAHVALFFYAGHGLQVHGESYVVPIDATLEHETDVPLELIAVQTILGTMELGNRTSLVFLDACRNNPLARNLARAIGQTRSTSVKDGLGQLESGIGTYISFATSPNRVALDGHDAPNSPFTAALLRHIETPSLTVSDMMIQVRQEVIEKTRTTPHGPQVPWENSSLVARFYFKCPPNADRQEPARPDPSVISGRAEQDWERFAIATTEYTPTIEAYIAQHQTNEPLWAARARQRLDVVQALLAERAKEQERRERERREAEESRRREAEQEAQYKAKGLIRVAGWTPKGSEPRWIAPGSGVGFRDFEQGPEMLIVPKGDFLMGSPLHEIAALTNEYGDHFKNEGPQHRVIIPEPFAIGRYAVTFAEWDIFVAAGRGGHRPEDKGWGRGDRPVINVNWDDAQAYLAWLSEQSGATYRLPSEAEWEYAARAGTVTPFWWGSSISTKQANYDGNKTHGGGPKGEYRQKTVPVKSFDPNPWGLYQVHGNVWEWVEDNWHGSYKDKPEALKADGGDWTTEGGGPRVLRGGSWYGDPQSLRSANRYRLGPDSRYSSIGFRVARTLTP